MSTARDGLMVGFRAFVEYKLQTDYHEQLKKRIRSALERRLMSSNRDRLKFGYRTWREYVHLSTKAEMDAAHEAIHKEHVHRRVRTALERRLMTSTKDMVKWGFKQWTVYAHMHSKEELKRAHEALHHETLKRRVKGALERRLMSGTKDMVKWGFRQWLGFVHMGSREAHATSVQALIDAHAAAMHEEIKQRVKNALMRRLMTSKREQLFWAFGSWKLLERHDVRDTEMRR